MYSVLPNNTTQFPWPGLKRRPLDLTNHKATMPPHTRYDEVLGKYIFYGTLIDA